MKLRQKSSLSELPICKCAGANDKEEASPEVDQPMHYIKSKRRVADHGEVFTPEWLVEAKRIGFVAVDELTGFRTPKISQVFRCRVRIASAVHGGPFPKW